MSDRESLGEGILHPINFLLEEICGHIYLVLHWSDWSESCAWPCLH